MQSSKSFVNIQSELEKKKLSLVLLKKWPSHYYSHWLLDTSKINVIEYEIFAEADKCVIAEQDLIFAVVRG